MTVLTRPIDFTLPESNVAALPAERRGAGRDDVRMMVARRLTGSVEHAPFSAITRLLMPGDVLVVNNSATIPAAVDAWSADGTRVKVHFANPAPGGLWDVEIRSLTGDGGTVPGPDWSPRLLRLAGGAELHLLKRNSKSSRLWHAWVDGVADVDSYLVAHGEPIRYAPGPALPIDAYQTVFSADPGSAEMPSAARAFTTGLVTDLIARGVVVVPITLHAGVSSYEDDEWPGDERYEVTEPTAAVINAMRSGGGKVIATGTTVVRALETVADSTGVVHPGRGVTDTVVTPLTGARAVDGLLTGWHEPRSSHLTLMESFLARDLLDRVYQEALDCGYLWHEFGDLLLILP
ncbi:MAG TPA: S-adenosylmethionine:tRNA ribosyltransferase-isomerase [Acidimicrobiia bacterium]|nr:S-adenosylmethionine:tRNA ribosyltransferase-isomerase [Acidimicrobiia bacterium]